MIDRASRVDHRVEEERWRLPGCRPDQRFHDDRPGQEEFEQRPGLRAHMGAECRVGVMTPRAIEQDRTRPGEATIRFQRAAQPPAQEMDGISDRIVESVANIPFWRLWAAMFLNEAGGEFAETGPGIVVWANPGCFRRGEIGRVQRHTASRERRDERITPRRRAPGHQDCGWPGLDEGGERCQQFRVGE